jgi:hypothetical protein
VKVLCARQDHCTRRLSKRRQKLQYGRQYIAGARGAGKHGETSCYHLTQGHLVNKISHEVFTSGEKFILIVSSCLSSNSDTLMMALHSKAVIWTLKALALLSLSLSSDIHSRWTVAIVGSVVRIA